VRTPSEDSAVFSRGHPGAGDDHPAERRRPYDRDAAV